MERLGRAQELQLDLIRLVSLDYFDGPAVVTDLLGNISLWQAAYMTWMPEASLAPMVALAADQWKPDTLYLLPSAECDEQLLELATRWDPAGYTWTAVAPHVPLSMRSRLAAGGHVLELLILPQE